MFCLLYNCECMFEDKRKENETWTLYFVITNSYTIYGNGESQYLKTLSHKRVIIGQVNL